MIFDIFKRKRKKNFKKMTLEVKNNIVTELFVPGGKYDVLNSDLQLLLSNMQKKAKDGNFKDINLETKFERERFVDGSKKTISITITQNQIKEFVSYIEKLYNKTYIEKLYNKKYFECAQVTIEGIYKTLLTIQFFLPEGKDKDFVKEQINELKKYKIEEKLEPITKSIRMTTDGIAERNKKDPAEKSNELFINIIANIDKLLNNIKDYDDLIEKILNNSTILWSDIEKDIISTFEKCFNAISISIENNLIDSEIYTNDEYIKVIEKFINIIPKEKQKIFNKCLETINIKKNKDCKDRKLYFKKGENKIEIEFCDLESKQDFKNEFSNIKSKIKHGRLNTILQDKNLSLESKILNITCNGRTYKGVNDVWDIENNYSDYNESHSSSPKSEKTDPKQVEQKNLTNSSISESCVSTYVKNKMKIRIEFNNSDSMKNFKEQYKLTKKQGSNLNALISSEVERKNFGISNITYEGKTYVGKNNIWDKRNYFNTKPKQTQNYFSR